MQMVSQAPYRQLRRTRVPCGDRRLLCESARRAPIGERRHRAEGRRALPSHTAMMAGARSRLKAAFSAQRSAFSPISPERDALGRPDTTCHAPPRREPARRARKHGRRSQGYNDRPGVCARSVSPVASGVNAPEDRPSVSAATSHRRSAQPSDTAR